MTHGDEDYTDLADAIAWAARAHRGQVYGTGPYIFHPLRVMLAVSPLAQIPAILHDVLEDYGKLPPALDPVTREAIENLTRNKDEQTYTEYIAELCQADGLAGDLAREVKMADLQDNLCHMTTDKRGLLPRYLDARRKLGQVREFEHAVVQDCKFCGQEYHVGVCCPDCMGKCKCPWSSGAGPNMFCPIHGLKQHRLPLFKGMH